MLLFSMCGTVWHAIQTQAFVWRVEHWFIQLGTRFSGLFWVWLSVTAIRWHPPVSNTQSKWYARKGISFQLRKFNIPGMRSVDVLIMYAVVWKKMTTLGHIKSTSWHYNIYVTPYLEVHLMSSGEAKNRQTKRKMIFTLYVIIFVSCWLYLE